MFRGIAPIVFVPFDENGNALIALVCSVLYDLSWMVEYRESALTALPVKPISSQMTSAARRLKLL